jgi:hypothetical protein
MGGTSAEAGCRDGTSLPDAFLEELDVTGRPVGCLAAGQIA